MHPRCPGGASGRWTILEFKLYHRKVNRIEFMKENNFQFLRTTLFVVGLLALIVFIFFREILPYQVANITWIIYGILGLMLFIIEIIKFRRDAKKK